MRLSERLRRGGDQAKLEKKECLVVELVAWIFSELMTTEWFVGVKLWMTSGLVR